TLFVRDGVGFAGRGEVARVPVDAAVDLLAAIEHDDRVGDTPGPIALGAIPFAPGAPAELIVPAVVVGRDATGRQWVTSIGDPDPELVAGLEPGAGGARYVLRPGVYVHVLLGAVNRARDGVPDGSHHKAGVARPVVVESERPIDVYAVLRRLTASFGSSYRFS